MDFGAVGQAAGSVVGSVLGWDTANKNAELQKQFAKQGIRWRVEDAQKAGIHPLYALGAQTHSFAPISTGDVSASLADMGQSIGRAVDSTRTAPEKIDAYTNSLRALELEHRGLQNELLKSQIAQNNASASAPMATADDPFLINGQVQSGVRSGLTNSVPLKRVTSQPGMPWAEPGAITGAGWENTPTGIAPVPSKDVKERIEDSPMEWMWFLRNNLIPTVSAEGAALRAPPKEALRRFPGAIGWRFNPILQEYQPVYPSRNSPRSSSWPVRRYR